VVTPKLLTDIVNSDNHTKGSVKKLFDKQKNNTATYEDKCAIKKYIHCTQFEIESNELTVDILKKIYEKYYVVKNNRRIKHIAGGCDEGDENIGEIYDDHDDFENLASDEKCKQILKLLKTIGYKITKDGIVKDIVSKEKLDEAKEKIVEIVDEKFKVLFKMKKCDVMYVENKLGKNKETNKKLLGWLNGLLENYGYIVVLNRKGKTTKGKVIWDTFYKLNCVIFIK
jgi:hypothetical protein